MWNINSISWQDIGADNTRYALLEGNRDAGMFIYAFFMPANFWDPPHWHSSDARVFVAQGCLKLAYSSDITEKTKLHSFSAGSFVLVPAHAVHWDGADEDTLIFGVAQGPWSTSYLDKNVSGSAGTRD
jgi:quercetin dioxygenase-like cupin family protein